MNKIKKMVVGALSIGGLLFNSGAVLADEVTYDVKPGDTLSKIAQEYDTSVNKIAKDNNIDNIHLIFIGDQLIVSDEEIETNNEYVSNTTVTQAQPKQETKTYSNDAYGSFEQITNELGITGYEKDAWSELIRRESNWNVYATNSSSGAYGLPQSLPGSKMASAGGDWQSNAYTQLKWMKSYVYGRYGSFSNALAHHNNNGWY